MKISLNKIHASPKPIRSSWDEEKMKELRWSLMEEGQVEPIGVHENHDGYVIVWGHRRVEAARRAGWDEIEAVIVKQDEIDNLIQAGIENLSGEDMNTDDKAEWAQRLLDIGLSQSEISRRSSVPENTIRKWLIYKKEKDQGVPMGTPKRSGDTDYRKINEIQLPRLLRIVEVANVLQVSKTTAYRLVQDGDLPAVRFAGTTVRVRWEDLEKFIEEHLGASEKIKSIQ